MFNNINIQLIIFLLVIVGPIIGKVGGWMVQQKKKRDEQLYQRHREEESFRTGRVSEPEPAGPSPEVLEQIMIAEQLRLQHEEMLRQRAAQADARRRVAQQRAEAARQRQGVPQPGVLVRDTAAPPKRKRPEQPKAPAQKAVKWAAPAARAAGPSAAIIGTMDKNSLRQAIIMSEVLGPPVSMREPTY
ncbi:MAG: hypothetical protein COB69_08070 [Phycisphaera sp.]|nr:MAG: hypothetical protein COB69_08070 [Phycisphaera sp.]